MFLYVVIEICSDDDTEQNLTSKIYHRILAIAHHPFRHYNRTHFNATHKSILRCCTFTGIIKCFLDFFHYGKRSIYKIMAKRLSSLVCCENATLVEKYLNLKIDGDRKCSVEHLNYF